MGMCVFMQMELMQSIQIEICTQDYSWRWVQEQWLTHQKNLGLVTTSSAEKEIVSTRERFPKCAWFLCFMLSQGADNYKEDMLMQDNEN